IFATGDIAHSGKAQEYALATLFFDALLGAAHLERKHLHIVPGNHDIDRQAVVGLARTLTSREEADSYFSPNSRLPHLQFKQGAFLHWYKEYFQGVRQPNEQSSCHSIVKVETKGRTLGLLSLNSAFFCQDDDDHGKLWLGRRCLDAAVGELASLHADLN